MNSRVDSRRWHSIQQWGAGFFKKLIGIFLLLICWQISVPLINLESYFYPAPYDVWLAFIDLLSKGILHSYLLDSTGRYLLGLFTGVSLALLLGVLIALNQTVAKALLPLINFLFAIVEVAWIPLFVMWFGYGLTTIVVALTYVAFFPMLFNTMSGIQTTPPVYINAAKTLGAGPWALIAQVYLPSALPQILTGLRTSAGFTFRGLIFSEMIASKSGIGFLIFEGSTNQQTARTIVGMICMGLAWMFLDLFYIKPIEKATVVRWGMLKTAENAS